MYMICMLARVGVVETRLPPYCCRLDGSLSSDSEKGAPSVVEDFDTMAQRSVSMVNRNFVWNGSNNADPEESTRACWQSLLQWQSIKKVWKTLVRVHQASKENNERVVRRFGLVSLGATWPHPAFFHR